MEEKLELREIQEEIKKFLNLEVLGLEVRIEEGKLIIVRKGENWRRSIHISLFYMPNGKLYLTVDVGYYPNQELTDEIRQKLESIKEKLKAFYRKFCPSIEISEEYIGYYGIKIKEFNTWICEVIGHVVAAVCVAIIHFSQNQ